MSWLATMLKNLVRVLTRDRSGAPDVEIARARARRAIAEMKQRHVQGLRPQTEKARGDLETLIEQALRGR